MKELLNECVAVLNGEVATGQSSVYVTIDRARYNALLQAIAEMKKEMIRQETAIHTREFRKKDRRQDDIAKKTLREIYPTEKCDGSGLVDDVRERNYRTCNRCGGGGCK